MSNPQKQSEICRCTAFVIFNLARKSKTMYISSQIFKQLYNTEYKHSDSGNTKWATTGFRSVFGVWDYEASYIWNTLDSPANKRTFELDGWQPKYLLDALFFMKCYSTERASSIFCGQDEKTLRKWNMKICDVVGTEDWVSASTL